MLRLKISLVAGLVVSQILFAADRSPTHEVTLQEGNIRVAYTALQDKIEPPRSARASEIFVMVFDDEERTERLFSHFRKLDYKPSYTTRRSGFNVGLVFAGKAEENPPMPASPEISNSNGLINAGATALNIAGMVVLAGATKLIGFGPFEQIPLLVKNPVVERPQGMHIEQVEFRDDGRKASSLTIFNVCESSNRQCSQVAAASYSSEISLDALMDIAIDEGVTRSLGLRD